MLPSVLSANLCSLHGNVDRLAVSVIWVMSADLKTVRSVWYGRTVIRNCQGESFVGSRSSVKYGCFYVPSLNFHFLQPKR